MTVKAYVYGCFAGFYWFSGSFKPRETEGKREREIERDWSVRFFCEIRV